MEETGTGVPVKVGRVSHFIATVRVLYSGADITRLRDAAEYVKGRNMWVLREHSIVQYLHDNSDVAGLAEFVIGYSGGDLCDIE